MKKTLLILSAALFAALGAQAQDDDVYFVPSAKDKTQKSDTYTASPRSMAGRSSYSPLSGEDDVTAHDTWADGRKGCGRDVDDYNRRGARYRYSAKDTAQAPEAYDEGYEDGYEDALYTSRLVRFYSPRVGVYVSSPYYWDWYDYAYDPFYCGYGTGWGWGWSGWYGWGSWYGWRPYYSSWYGWGGWGDPWWGWGGYAYHHPHGWGWGWGSASRPASGGNWHVGNRPNLFANTSRTARPAFNNTSRSSRQWDGARTSRGSSFGTTQNVSRGSRQGVVQGGSRTLDGAFGNTSRGNRVFNNNTNNSSRQIDRSMQVTPQRSFNNSGSVSAPSRSSMPSAPRTGGGGGFGGGRGGRIGGR